MPLRPSAPPLSSTFQLMLIVGSLPLQHTPSQQCSARRPCICGQYDPSHCLSRTARRRRRSSPLILPPRGRPSTQAPLSPTHRRPRVDRRRGCINVQ
jgi:hypothetical protein